MSDELYLSVIIPTYNTGSRIDEAVQSVLDQSAWKNEKISYEIIIVDDGSTKEYKTSLETTFAKSNHVKITYRKENGGPAAARNTGLKIARGRLISFLDADDIWAKNKLELALPYFQNEEVDVVSGFILHRILAGVRIQNDIFDGQAHSHVSLGATVVRKSLFDQGFLFDEKLYFAEDFDWWYRIREARKNIIILEEVMMIYRMHGNNMTSNKTFHDYKITALIHQSIQRRKRRQVAQLGDFRVNRPDPLISMILSPGPKSNISKDTVLSLIRQNYSNWELFLTGDLSQISEKWFHPFGYKVKILECDELSSTKQLTQAISAARGELMVFVNEEMVCEFNQLFVQWQHLRNNPYDFHVVSNQSNEESIVGWMIRSHVMKALANKLTEATDPMVELFDILNQVESGEK